MRSRMPFAHLALALATGAGLGACGSGTPAEVVVTVTGTPSASPTPSSTASTRVKAPTSDVKGRRFDFGEVTGAKRKGDVDVLVLDRWTDPKVKDAVVAEHGLPVTSWKVGSNRYVNQNAKKTFDIPVAEGATFLLHHCVAAGEPLQTRSVGAAELADAPESDRLLLVRIDRDGWGTSGETFAGC
ncbi:MAG: hypothetical protein ACJ711_02510 [Ornithinibacter sp.]